MGDFTWQDVHKLAAQGCTQQETADRLGTSRSTVSRILAAGPPADLFGDGPRLRDVEAIAKELGDVNAATRAVLGIARSIAAKLDQVHEQKTAASAVAVANLARQYRDTLAELKPAQDADKQWLANLLVRTHVEHEEEAARYRGVLQVIASARSDGSRDYRLPRCSADEAQRLAREVLYPAGDYAGEDGFAKDAV